MSEKSSRLSRQLLDSAFARRVADVASRMKLHTKIWWAIGAALGSAWVLLWAARAAQPETTGIGCLSLFMTFLLVLWALPTGFWALLWLWNRLTYRVWVRLLISYLLVGVVPIPLLLGLLGGGAYVLIGQYTSAALGELELQIGHGLNQWTEAAVEPGGIPSIDLPRTLSALEPRARWLVATDGEIDSRHPEATLDLPRWAAQGTTEGHFVTSSGPILASIERRGDRIAAAWIPLDAENSRAISRERWFEARFLGETAVIDDQNQGFTVRSSDDGQDDEAADDGAENTPDDGPDVNADEDTEEEELFESELVGEGWLGKRWIFFMRLSPEPTSWADGSRLENESLPTLLTTSPREGVSNLFSSPYQIGPAVGGLLLFIGGLDLAAYLVALVLAIAMILAITRSTARLTGGARRVEAGDLGHRIPVRRKDQLGDLAAAFNGMAQSVESMLAEVADKERMKKELELAREIQQSLLPTSNLQHGSITVRAHFQPAEEVGGDYFDLFPLEKGKLIVAVGDVAGHGLPTGLLMAMVKSAVAALVREGHRGPELLVRLNDLMLEQPREHRMVTLAVAEIDTQKGTAVVTNAAHPPLFLTGEGVREVMLPALPIGFPWRQPPPSSTLELAPGARLIFYSDGLVEAQDPEGEQFGYERLQDLLGESLDLASDALLDKILSELARHTAGRPHDDDLTLLIIDCGAQSPPLDSRRRDSEASNPP